MRASELLPAEIANRDEAEEGRVDGHGEQRRTDGLPLKIAASSARAAAPLGE